MFPNDAVTVFHELVGVSNYQFLPTGTYTILGVSVQQSATNSTSELMCGNTTLVKNYGKDFPYNNVHFLCESTVSVQKTGQDSASFIITYVPYKIQTVSTTTPMVVNGFTYGEILIIFVLLLMFSLSFFSELKNWLFGVYVENQPKNKYDKTI